jgi:integrase/recombinase XerC
MTPQTELIPWRVAPSLHWTEDFAAWLHAHDRRPKTISAYLQDLRHFGCYFEQVNGLAFTPSHLNAIDVKAYFAAQDADKQVAATSRNRRLASLRVLVGWAVEADMLEYDPTVSVKRQEVELAPRDRTNAEMARLEEVVRNGLHIRCAGHGHAWLAGRDRIMWALFKKTGLRIHEIAALRIDDLDFDANEIHVLGKGGRKAMVTISSDLRDLLVHWAALNPSAETLVCGLNGRALTTGQIRRRIQMIGEAAGIHDLRPHDLRHTYAYQFKEQLMDRGLDESKAKDAVRRQLRHSDERTTQLYFRARQSEIRAAVEAM